MARPAKSQPRLLIYTGDNCPYCHQLKQFLRQQGQRFQERNIQRSRAAEVEYQRRGLRGIPVLVMGKTIIPGFQPERISALLNKTNPAKPEPTAKAKRTERKGNSP